MPDFFQTKLVWVHAGSGSGLESGLGLELVSKVVFWAFFEISLLITLEPHVGHTNQMSYKKNTEVEVLPVVDFSKNRRNIIFLWEAKSARQVV